MKQPLNVLYAQITTTYLRKLILESISLAGNGHPGGSLSILDTLYWLYDTAKHNSQKPQWKKRDRIILSAGHLAPAFYTILAHHGYFSKDLLFTLRQFGSPVQGHPHRNKLPGVENTSGPLGQGVVHAVGRALAVKEKVYCISSDGEHDEGVVWEAAQFAAHHELGNLVLLIDVNGIQLSGHTKDILNLRSLVNKYRSFGWEAQEIDGHDHVKLKKVFTLLKKRKSKKPLALILNTTLGKGVHFMEDNPQWHGKALSPEQLITALRELDEHIRSLALEAYLSEREVIQ